MRVTLKQIAERASVSQGAVSAVLSNVKGIRVSQKTSEKILRISRELNYRPDFASIALKNGKTGLLGFICGGLYLPFFAELATLMMKEANQRKRHLLMMPLDWENHDEIECLNEMLDRVDGLFMSSSIMGEVTPGQEIIKQRRTPFVLMNYRCPGISCVSIDFLAGMDKAFAHLLERGHRKIAFAGEPGDSHKLDAYDYCCKRYGTENIKYFYSLNEPVEKIVECGAEIAGRKERQTALISSDYGLSLLTHGMAQVGLRIPEELSLIVFAPKTTHTPLFRPKLTTVTLDCEAMARYSMAIMDNLLAAKNGEMQPESIILQPELLVHRSVVDISR